MRTNIVLDDELVREASRLTGIRTKRSLVDEALRLLVRTKKRRSILALKGKVRFAEGYDHKALRERSLGPR
jgi:Arc/MetJ family transcription regulator